MDIVSPFYDRSPPHRAASGKYAGKYNAMEKAGEKGGPGVQQYELGLFVLTMVQAKDML
jgi:hypothetical protein